MRPCEPYRNAGRVAYHFARGKFSRRSRLTANLELGLLLACARALLDLGCGQGLLAAGWQAAERCYDPAAAGEGLAARAREPCRRAESSDGFSDVERARCALGSASEVSQADIRNTAFGKRSTPSSFWMFCHYMTPQAQLEVLQRVRAALAAGPAAMARR